MQADVERIGEHQRVGARRASDVEAAGRFRTKAWGTGIVDVSRGQLLDIVPGRTAEAPAKWLLAQPDSWRAGIGWAALDLSGPYRAAFDTALPHAQQVADPFHVVKLANNASTRSAAEV